MGADRNTSGLRCLIRRAFPGANPLRRRTDLFEPIAVLLVVLIAAVTAVVAFSVSQNELNTRLAAVEREQASRHQVVATVVAELPSGTTSHRPVAVRWGQPPDERFAVLDLPARVRAAGSIPVWLDDRGQLTGPPLTRSDATEAAGLAGAGVLLGSALATTLALLLSRAWIQHRRMLAWEAEWAEVEPRWRHRTS
ncbi:hypothetical protein SAMN05421805_1011324 [Saccharopolyspora antimicrobica]|uniref:Uncharacterized protein n=1 Tax=Saccharopolyspora antimicrobica TaxID=455193 RepID=A0A1I4T875_9PSEU|nr:hypothetical protein [Saccharopolyspora antimicrobica]RKT85824.1 hypothetical protein ATL45_4180 [Saccharopolyspora antimicrobica]SFM72793.1 hypothetical protein SAMN05421805_1011324 [Saccharopolyspora antimicrobica]